MFNIDRSLPSFNKNGISDAKHLVGRTLNDPKPIILTHWIETGVRSFNIKYNAYEDIKDLDYDIPGATMGQYEKITELVTEKFASGYYTHLIIGCTGCNNYQHMSMETYNKWLQYTLNAANDDNREQDFKPFFIGLTWPARWITPVLSFFNKANDADEIGMTHMCSLIWKYLLPAVKKLNSAIPVVTIGHSFGGRLLSRANHSKFMHNQTTTEDFIDLAIEFQGAYPISRFCEKKGSNGGLYTVQAPIKRHVMTCSKYDHAIKQPIWSHGYIGDSKSIRKLKANATASQEFEFIRLDENGMLIDFRGEKKRVLVDAASIIFESDSFIVGAHSDVKDKEIGRFIWELIKRIQ